MAQYTINIVNKSGVNQNYVAFLDGGAAGDAAPQASIEHGASHTVTLAPTEGALGGAYQIAAKPDFTPANNYVFGLASDNGSAIPLPVPTLSTAPNETASVDFRGRPETNATVTQGDDGAFSVEYS
ncbi:hypothetical protein [Caulobacter segnis]